MLMTNNNFTLLQCFPMKFNVQPAGLDTRGSCLVYSILHIGLAVVITCTTTLPMLYLSVASGVVPIDAYYSIYYKAMNPQYL